MNEEFYIDNTSELSIDEAFELQKKGVKFIVVGKEKNSTCPIYDYILVKARINGILSELPEFLASDKDREKKIFTYIYVKVASLVKYYEEAAEFLDLSGYDRDMAYDHFDIDWEAARTIVGLLRGRTLCSGYSKILMNLLAECGIKATYIHGSGHAWNQVFLDGKWYNCDITNDHDFILAGLKLPFFLKSNEEFSRYEKYPVNRNEVEVNEATVSISDKDQEELINEAKRIAIPLENKETKKYEANNKNELNENDKSNKKNEFSEKGADERKPNSFIDTLINFLKFKNKKASKKGGNKR